MSELNKQVILESIPKCYLRLVPIARSVLRRDICLHVAPVFCIARALLLKPPSALYRAFLLYHAETFLRYPYFSYPSTVSCAISTYTPLPNPFLSSSFVVTYGFVFVLSVSFCYARVISRSSVRRPNPPRSTALQYIPLSISE